MCQVVVAFRNGCRRVNAGEWRSSPAKEEVARGEGTSAGDKEAAATAEHTLELGVV